MLPVIAMPKPAAIRTALPTLNVLRTRFTLPLLLIHQSESGPPAAALLPWAR